MKHPVPIPVGFDGRVLHTDLLPDVACSVCGRLLGLTFIGSDEPRWTALCCERWYTARPVSVSVEVEATRPTPEAPTEAQANKAERDAAREERVEAVAAAPAA